MMCWYRRRSRAHPAEPPIFASHRGNEPPAAGIEALAREALESLTIDQLRAVRWIGLTDDGWARMFRGLERRGAHL
jgi:hypothetical protein